MSAPEDHYEQAAPSVEDRLAFLERIVENMLRREEAQASRSLAEVQHTLRIIAQQR